MKSNNCKGFVTVELLVVSAFLMSLFAIIFVNSAVFMGEYEKREVYDDVNSKYGMYWIIKLIKDNNKDTASSEVDAAIGTNTFIKYENSDVCTLLNAEQENSCRALVSANDIKTVYITSYKITDFKNTINNSDITTEGFKIYINSLPSFTVASKYNNKYRMFVEFERTSSTNGEKYLSYSNMEFSI